MNHKFKLALATLAFTPLILSADMDRCVSCHGVDFEVKALGTSKIVKNMTEKQIKKSLDGYKKGIGGSMKEIMMKEVNVGVDTDAMAADIYNEITTPGFEEPSDEFVFQKRISVKTLQKIKLALKKATKKDMKKIYGQIKTAAFTMYTYDKLLQQKVDFANFKAKKLSKKDILQTVTKAKKCVDHSFTNEEMVKCRIDFMNLAGTLTQNEAKMMKKNMKKAPIYTDYGAVDISKYLEHK